MYKPGSRLKSAACSTEIVVVKPPQAGEITCGGAVMAEAAATVDPAPLADGWDTGAVLGKRYEDVDTGLQVLVVKGGHGTLGIDGRALTLVEAKALPASD
ncbi:hypothetical protein ACN94_02740 [Gordonia paraffinivorans]|uniref:hypothetical protein n=1 Tax=Gordonia paraffinivorans TaxID=175628 RepID=UPI000D60EA09|nr:hypothetical protein [Gordonia paraffinivorans]MBY4572523.1 hypothetical protein [Gordonia paraffinivorans]PWD41619.1 hypothetical protein ACN93_18365 [Gordonia paraffinivorans]